MRDDYDENEYSEHYEPRPPGMSAGTKVLLISLGVLGFLLVACCGGVIWFVRKNFDVKMSEDPVIVRQTQRDILDMTLPNRYEPMQSVRAKIVFADMDMAMFQAAGEEQSQLAVMKMIFRMDEVNQQQVESEFNQKNPGAAELAETSSESRKYTVDGKEFSVTFAHGTLKQHENAPAGEVGKEWYSVSSMIPTAGGMVMFKVTGPEDEFNEEEIESMIESIRFSPE